MRYRISILREYEIGDTTQTSKGTLSSDSPAIKESSVEIYTQTFDELNVEDFIIDLNSHRSIVPHRLDGLKARLERIEERNRTISSEIMLVKPSAKRTEVILEKLVERLEKSLSKKRVVRRKKNESKPQRKTRKSRN